MKIQLCEFRSYGPRPGMEGPLLYPGGKVLYWDFASGEYYDPDTDLPLTVEEYEALHVFKRKEVSDAN